MDSFEWNKVFGAILAAALLVMVLRVGGEMALHTEAPEKLAYAVNLPETATATSAAEEEAPAEESIGILLASADAGKGQRVFNKCQACHSIEQGGANKIGPNLYNVLGRAVGGADGFNYSGALSDWSGEWTYELMNAWLAKPADAIPGNKMSFAGLNKAADRANVIAYMREYADNPPPIPAAEADGDTASLSIELGLGSAN